MFIYCYVLCVFYQRKLNQYGIKAEYVLCLREYADDLEVTPKYLNTFDSDKTHTNDGNTARNVGMCVCITACVTWFCASITDCFCGICECIGDCCSNMCECIGSCCGSICDTICSCDFNPCVCLFMIVWCTGWFGGSGFAAYSVNIYIYSKIYRIYIVYFANHNE